MKKFGVPLLLSFFVCGASLRAQPYLRLTDLPTRETTYIREGDFIKCYYQPDRTRSVFFNGYLKYPSAKAQGIPRLLPQRARIFSRLPACSLRPFS